MLVTKLPVLFYVLLIHLDAELYALGPQKKGIVHLGFIDLLVQSVCVLPS